MKYAASLAVLVFLSSNLLTPALRGADLEISEFMAVNNETLLDEDGDASDWIEVHNTTAGTVNLEGWYLTDDDEDLTKWPFPSTNLAANAYIIVFASNKDRRDPGGELHANFRLTSDGEYLALVQTNEMGATIATEFSPYPVQVADVAYGLAKVASTDITLLAPGAPVKALVPADASLEPSGQLPEELRPWTLGGLDDSGWLMGTTGVGYDLSGTYLPFVGLNVQAAMLDKNETIYIRVPFNVPDPNALASMTLRMRYEDGVVVYLNGFEVYRDNVNGNPVTPSWNTGAAASRSGATTPIDADITSKLGFLGAGENILAIQGLNRFVGSSDLLVLPELLASGDSGVREPRYFVVPSPGEANSQGTQTVGPVITDEGHEPNVPLESDPIVVTARVRDALNSIDSATLHYRVMFDAEVQIPFADDGMNGDEGTGDGVYGAIIPAGVAGPGQMVRWYITAEDAMGNSSRWPPFEDTLNSPEYEGTVVYNPGLTNPLPVLHMFIQNYSAAATDQGTRCSFFYLDEFYDNLNINIHGQSSRGFSKHSFDVDFHRGYNFRWEKGKRRVDDINLLTTYPDKAAMRNVLAWETYRDADCAYHFVVPVRVERNGAFEGIWHIVENGDVHWLRRLNDLGFDQMNDGGKLYKMYNTFTATSHATSTTGAEQKTLKEEDLSHNDILDMYNNMAGNGANSAGLRNYAYDNMNIPQIINHLAARVITGDIDCCHKNYYFYRDTAETGEWQMLPWDVDLSYGRLWNSSDTYWDEVLHPDRGGFTGGNNTVPSRIFGTSEMRQMYLRRMRTLMDTIMQSPDTPGDQLLYEKKIDEWADKLAPDGVLDLAKWGTFGNGAQNSTCCIQTIREAADEIKDFYLPARRDFMFNSGTFGEVPDAQPADTVISFGTIDYNPASGNQEEEYFILRNQNGYAVDISGWKIEGGVEHTFHGGVVIPANSDLYVAANVNAFRARATAPRGGMGLFVRGNFKGQLSARGETLSLVDTTGRIVSTVDYPGLPSPAQSFLRVTELMYNPPNVAGSSTNSDEYEYVELINTGLGPISLAGVRFTNGISFDFTSSAVTSLASGERVLVVRNLAAFEERYGAGHNVAGEYVGNLNNGGERIELIDGNNEKILEFSYNNSWYPITDGLGFSLVIIDANAPFNTWDEKESWRPSGVDGGSPGADDAPLATVVGVVVNEVLAHTDFPDLDSIELSNTNVADVDIGGWYISDDPRNAKKFQIPSPTVVPAGGYVVFTEDDFNNPPTDPQSFSFSSLGDEAFVFSADGAGNLTGYRHGYSFGASATGVSFGPHVNSAGKERFVAQSMLTSNAPNSGPLVGPVVISEINYHPADVRSGADLIDNVRDEYIELQNITGSPVDLFDPVNPANTWRLTGGVDLEFPIGVTIPAMGHALVVPFNPANNSVALAAFRAKHGLAESVPVIGPMSTDLSNAGDSLRLSRPDTPVAGSGEVPYILVDRVDYEDDFPWDFAADGIGPVLQRIDVTAYGDDPANWIAAQGNPAQSFVLGTPPTITKHPQDLIAVAFNDAVFTVEVTGPGPFSFQWRYNGSILVGETDQMLVLHNVQPSDAGEYQVAVLNASGSASSSNATLTVAIPASILVAPESQSIRQGENVTFTIQATSSTPITYQWRFNGEVIPGETGTSLTIENVQLGTHNGTYDVLVTDSVGTVASPPAALTVLVNPVVLTPRVDRVVPEGSTVTLFVETEGTLPMGYRWRRGGFTLQIEVVNSHISYLTIPNFSAADVGLYNVICTNEAFYLPGVQGVIGSLSLGPPIADTDADGIPDDVENAMGLNPNDPNDADTVDGDGDNYTALKEYIAGTSDSDDNDYPKLTAIALENGGTRVSFEAKAGKFYTVQYTDGLNPPVWAKLVDPAPLSADGIVEVIDPNPPADGERVYRFVTPRQE